MSRLEEALNRLERAVARLEAVCGGGGWTAPSGDDDKARRAAMDEIAARVDGALAQIGRVLGEEG